MAWGKNILERSTGHTLDVLVNANSFRDRINCLDQRSSFTFFSRPSKFYSLNFQVIDIKRIFQRNRLLYYLEGCHFTEYVG